MRGWSSDVCSSDHSLSIHVFDFDAPSAMQQSCRGEDVGTLITQGEDELFA